MENSSFYVMLKDCNNGMLPASFAEWCSSILYMSAGFICCWFFLFCIALCFVPASIKNGVKKSKDCCMNISKKSVILSAKIAFWVMLVCFISGFFMTPSGRLIWFK